MIDLGQGKISYTLKRFRRQKRINMHVRDDGLLVTAALSVPIYEIERALHRNKTWLMKNISHHAVAQTLTVDPLVVAHLKKRLLPKIQQKLAFYNTHYNFTYTRVTIRNQRSRWGSCSSSGSLNFNVHLAGLSELLIDYVVVHELCHIKEMNHSPAFWALVEECIPSYKKCRAALKEKSLNMSA